MTVLSEIFDHKSYASKGYYYWTYVQYFSSMFSVILSMSRKLKIGGSGLIVVQSSFYKDVKISLSKIIVEMMAAVGLESEVVKQEKVSINMKNLHILRSEEQEKFLEKKPTEDVIYFKKVNNLKI